MRRAGLRTLLLMADKPPAAADEDKFEKVRVDFWARGGGEGVLRTELTSYNL